jgi:putative transposase
MRNTKFTTNEFYHVYNRGTEKRDIFEDKEDVWRFWEYLTEINSVENIGSLYLNQYRKKYNKKSISSKLVNIISYCLNQNHFHFILEPVDISLFTYYIFRFINLIIIVIIILM